MINTVKADVKEPGIQKIRESKNVVEYRFDNGLKVLLLENHSAPVVTLLVLYKVGSRNEGVGYTGSTHFLEHMLFKGTKKHNPDKGNGIDDLLTQIGAYWNATTWFDRTSYFEVVPAEYLDLCVQLEADRMRNLLLRQEDHDSEMSVVRNEMERGENYPEDVLEKELYAQAFREHPYHHPTIGWRSDVECVPMDRLREFYNTFYWPNNATVILVGDYKSDEALALIHKHYGKIATSPKPIPEVYTTEPKQEGERRFEVNRVGDLARVWLGFHVPEAAHKDNYALAAMRHILGSTYERSSRLYKRLIDTSLAAETFARHDDLRDPGLFIIGATVNPDVEIEAVENAIVEELKALATEPVAAQELERAKSANRKGTILSKADPSSLAFMLGEAESKADWMWLMDYDDHFDAVTPADIMRVAKDYFNRENRTVGRFIPKAPGGGDAEQGAAEMTPPEQKQAPAGAHAVPEMPLDELLAEKPQMTRVKLKKTKGSSFASQVHKEVLPNGLTVMLMRNPGTESIGVNGCIRAGKYFSFDKGGNVSDLVADVLPKGSAKYNKLQIAELLENMGIPGGLEFNSDNYRMSFGTHLVASDLSLYLDLLSDVIRKPAFLADEVAKTKIEWSSRFTEALNNTRMMAWNKLRREIFPAGHLLYEVPFEEQAVELDKLMSEDLALAHKKLFSPKATILTLVGDLEIDDTLELIRSRFGDWTGDAPPPVKMVDPPLPAKRKRLDVFLADKKSADVVIAHPTTLRRTAKDFYAAKLANAALGQDTITSRLGNVVRDRAGLTYGIYSAFSDTAFGSAPWSVSFSVNPANIDKALHLVDEVLKDFMENGITQDELAREVGRAVGSFTVGLASSLGIARAVTEFEFLGLGVAELDKLSSHYLHTTKEQVDKAMRQYFHPQNAVTVVAGTF
jgi:zinc protease